MEETRKTFDFTAVSAPALAPAPAPAPEPTSVVVSAPGIAYTTYPLFADPPPVRPFRLRFGGRNKF
jgi:hypothetical protein